MAAQPSRVARSVRPLGVGRNEGHKYSFKSGSSDSATGGLEDEVSAHLSALALESRARRIRATRSSNHWDTSASAMIEREMALVLDEIERLRALHDAQLGELLTVECYTDTELLQMEDRTPRYSPYRYPERERLQARLFALGQERRRVRAAQEDRLQPLHRRLLALLEQQRQLER